MINLKHSINVFIGGCSFGILSTFVKLAYSNGYSPSEVIGSQYFVGAILFWTVLFFSHKSKVSISMGLKLLVAGMPMALTGIFYYISLQYLDASIAIVLLFQFTWMGMMFEWIIEKNRPTKKSIGSVLLLFLGSIFSVNLFGTSLQDVSMTGVIWGLLAAISFTTFIYVSARVGKEVPPMLKSSLMATGAFLITFIIFPPVFLVEGTFINGLWIWGLLLGFFGVVLPPLLFSISMPKIGSGLGTILSASELPMAILMSIIVLHEVVNFIQWIGVFIVLFGIVYPYLKVSTTRKKVA
ncbi:EamA family transporter [Oceanobacillus jeddahense]|uniref:EamA family transporter n=1 Tax=Oceanobacillus jeddahense TaxID=1462527 RepID=UPI000595CBAE|nr:DMT family transporter [Oceanobacillus jeddahense]